MRPLRLGGSAAASAASSLTAGGVTNDRSPFVAGQLVQRTPGAPCNGAPFVDLPKPLAKLRPALLKQTREEAG